MPEMNDSLPAELKDVFPDDLMMGRALPGAMLVDLKRIADLTEEQVSQVNSALTKQTGVPSVADVRNLVSKHLDDEIALSVTRTAINVSPASTKQYLTILDRYRGSNAKVAELFDDTTFSMLEKNLRSLIKDKPAIQLMRKAQRLLGDTGNELESVLFVCDMRPVFDDDHEKVEGLISLANMKLAYKTQSDHDVNLELVLSSSDLNYLIEQCEDAKSKLAVLERDFINNQLSKAKSV